MRSLISVNLNSALYKNIDFFAKQNTANARMLSQCFSSYENLRVRFFCGQSRFESMLPG